MWRPVLNDGVTMATVGSGFMGLYRGGCRKKKPKPKRLPPQTHAAWAVGSAHAVVCKRRQEYELLQPGGGRCAGLVTRGKDRQFHRRRRGQTDEQARLGRGGGRGNRFRLPIQREARGRRVVV